MTVFDTDELERPIGNTGVLADYSVTLQNGLYAINIHIWYSQARGRGNTTQALSELRSQWPNSYIIARQVGQPKDSSYKYWQHQLAKGRIDAAVDDFGWLITPKLKQHQTGFHASTLKDAAQCPITTSKSQSRGARTYQKNLWKPRSTPY